MTREMFVYPWDAYDEGLEVFITHLHEMKISHVSLAVLYHHARILLPHNPVRKLLLHKGGSLYVPFDPESYGLMKPDQGTAVPASFVTELIQRLKQEGIGVSAWSVLLHNSVLAQKFPAFALENVYGDSSPSNLCPSNEAVEDYAVQVCKDITKAGFDRIDAESLDYAGFLHGDHHEMQAYSDTAALNRWLGLCFCPACMKKAAAFGVNGKKLKSQVRKAADALLNLKPIPQVDQALLEAYDTFRCVTVTNLFRRVEAETGLPVCPIVWAAGGANPKESGVDPEKIKPRQMILCYPASPEDTSSFLRRNQAAPSAKTEIIGGIRLMSPQTTDSFQVLMYEDAYRKNGIGHVIFYQYGMAPKPFLDQLSLYAEGGGCG